MEVLRGWRWDFWPTYSVRFPNDFPKESLERDADDEYQSDADPYPSYVTGYP